MDFDSKIFDHQSFLNIRIEYKVLLTFFIDNHLIIDYPKGLVFIIVYPKGLVFTCATPGESSKGGTVKIFKRKKRER